MLIISACVPLPVPGGPNNISFTSGSAVLDLTFPYKSRWYVSVQFEIGGRIVFLASPDVSEDQDATEITGLPAGNYTLSASCRDGGTHTNITVKATLAEDERKAITF